MAQPGGTRLGPHPASLRCRSSPCPVTEWVAGECLGPSSYSHILNTAEALTHSPKKGAIQITELQVASRRKLPGPTGPGARRWVGYTGPGPLSTPGRQHQGLLSPLSRLEAGHSAGTWPHGESLSAVGRGASSKKRRAMEVSHASSMTPIHTRRPGGYAVLPALGDPQPGLRSQTPRSQNR